MEISNAQTIFNYNLRVLYTGCQWKELAINKDSEGVPEIHYFCWFDVPLEDIKVDQGTGVYPLSNPI